MAVTKELSFSSLAEQFLREYRAKTCRSVEEFARRHPEMAETIRRDFLRSYWPSNYAVERKRKRTPRSPNLWDAMKLIRKSVAVAWDAFSPAVIPN